MSVIRIRAHNKWDVKNYEESMNSTVISFKHSLQVHSKAMNVHSKAMNVHFKQL